MAAPRPAKDLKPTDARARLLKKMQQDKLRRDAKQFNKQAKAQAADKKVRPASDIDHRKTRTDSRAKFLRQAKTGKIKAATTPTSAASKAGLLGKAAKKIPVVGAAIGFIADAGPAGSAQERSWERRNTEQRRMKGKVSGSAMGSFSPKQAANKPLMPKVSMAGGGVNNPPAKTTTSSGSYSGYGSGTSSAAYGYKAKKAAGVNQFEMAKSNAEQKKKAGATTSAAPATPKRKTNLERMRRRQAERFAIGSSGKSL